MLMVPELGLSTPPLGRITRSCFQTIFFLTPKIGEDYRFDSYFSDGLVQPPTCINNP